MPASTSNGSDKGHVVRIVTADGGEETSVSLAFAKGESAELCFVNERLHKSQAFSCSIATLRDAALGAKTHLASSKGTCEIVPMSATVVFSITLWNQQAERYTVSREAFDAAVRQIVEAGSTGD